MANKYWTPEVEKFVIALSMLIVGYAGVSMSFPSLWQLPAALFKQFIGTVSLVTIASAFVIYGAIMLYMKY